MTSLDIEFFFTDKALDETFNIEKLFYIVHNLKLKVC